MDSSDDLKNEAKILQNLRHPNIIMYYGWHKNKHEQVMLVMEFCEHGSLFSFLQSTTLTKEQNIKW